MTIPAAHVSVAVHVIARPSGVPVAIKSTGFLFIKSLLYIIDFLTIICYYLDSKTRNKNLYMKNPNSHPYEYLDRNVEAVQSKQDEAPKNKTREIAEIENGMIDDTISLIEILDGTINESDRLLAGERESTGAFDAAIFLDKSARPVRQLTHNIWNKVSAEKEPKSLFLNIDKRPWLTEMGHVDTETTNQEAINPDMVDLDRVDPAFLHDQLTRMRALYVEGEIDEDNLEDVWNRPTRMDGKTIAIIDEVRSSGNTLRIAANLLRRAVPEASFEGMWWSTPPLITWEGGESNNFERQKAATIVPVWYDKVRESGRGIGDIDEQHSAQSPNKLQRIGKSILSAPERDAEGNYNSHLSLSAVVRRDLGRLANRFVSGNLVRYRPSEKLDDDEFDKRIELYYQKPADEVYKQWRAEQNR